jgi:ABC-type sugar transport system permease subunit
MAVIADKQKRPFDVPPVIVASVIWHLILIAVSLFAARELFQMTTTEFNEEYSNIGNAVKTFMTFVLLIPAGLGAYSIIQSLRKQGSGRYAALILNYGGMVLAGAYLLHLWGVYSGIDNFAAEMLDNAYLLLGFVAGYLLFWIAGRMEEDSPMQLNMERAGLALSMITLILLLLSSDAIGAVTSILDTYGDSLTWVVTIVIIVFGLFFREYLRLGKYFGETTAEQTAWQGWLMLSPNIIGFLLFFGGPLLLSFYLSFTDASVGQVPNFIALDNYTRILGLEVKGIDDGQTVRDVLSDDYNELWRFSIGDSTYLLGASDPLFWISLRNTIFFCFLLVPISSIPALFLAIVLNSKIPGVQFFRAVYFLPSVAAVVGTSLIWRWLYDPTIGYFNYFITQAVTFLNSLGMNITDPKAEWLTTEGTAMMSVVFLAAWQVVGFNTVIFLAGLQGIPGILYEAAYVDGANRWQQFRNVTIPMLAPTTFFVIITTIITGLQVFNEIYTLFVSRPLPEHVTTSVYYLYNRGFFRFEFGYASSMAWLLFALIFTITLIQFRVSRSAAYED